MVPRSLDNCSQKQSQVQGDEGAIPVSLLARKTNGAVLLNTGDLVDSITLERQLY